MRCSRDADCTNNQPSRIAAFVWRLALAGGRVVNVAFLIARMGSSSVIFFVSFPLESSSRGYLLDGDSLSSSFRRRWCITIDDKILTFNFDIFPSV